MVKGTPSMGKRIGTKHVRCRRCGKRSYHLSKKKCAHCGFGVSSKIKKYSWKTKGWRRIGRLI